ncbi:polyprenyl synthetase family protein [Dactylosporangium matsuzakiense]|uniref:polyprenyl synthetase family protein n=2 Tax=Dactylosporangium matsuzakiense TaxID=53360 RepID=UPI0021C3195D|nr:polyprenyl synthetase family protein [Dactylosporangium matsuzakiense]UWZ43672.1 polyprenyl synthetase family protein [Dactylosporangium matsuzakiense]
MATAVVIVLRTTDDILRWAGRLVDPPLRTAIGRLPEPSRAVAELQLGWHLGDAVSAASLRSALTLVCADAVGGDPHAAVPGAVAVELMHHWSAIRRDLVEERPDGTAWSIVGPEPASLGGEALLALAYDVIATGDPTHARRSGPPAATAWNDAALDPGPPPRRPGHGTDAAQRSGRAGEPSGRPRPAGPGAPLPGDARGRAAGPGAPLPADGRGRAAGPGAPLPADGRGRAAGPGAPLPADGRRGAAGPGGALPADARREGSLPSDTRGGAAGPRQRSGQAGPDRAMLRILGDTVQELLHGQHASLALRDNRSDSAGEERTDLLRDCLAMVEQRTGALFGCACALGAVAGGGDPAQVERLRVFGVRLGLAVQFTEDLLEIWGGGGVGADLRRRRRSLPVAAAVAAGADELTALFDSRAQLSEADVERAAKTIEQSGALDWCRRQADELLSQALLTLDLASPSPTAIAELVALARRATATPR